MELSQPDLRTSNALAIERPYRLSVGPIPGRTVARRGDVIVACSEHAKIMHETRLPSVVYFPREDVIGLTEELSSKRTFCPFKGTAVYEHLRLGTEFLENAVWSYPQALSESEEIKGYVAFMPGVIDTVEASIALQPEQDDGHLSGPLIDWLLKKAWAISDPAELTRQLALRFRQQGIPVARMNIAIWPLHPEIAGYSYVWTLGSDEIEVSEQPNEILVDEKYLNSPIRFVREGLGGVRQPLDGRNIEFKFPILDELVSKGATDYVALPLVFSDGRINVLTMSTDIKGGFSTANLGLVYESSLVISRYYEVLVQKLDAQALLETYLGKRTGSRVLKGEIKRGDGEEIDATILFCDLRNSSHLSNTLERHEYLGLLNEFFELVSEYVIAFDGEILKFVGDAVLAIFQPMQTPASASMDAISAAKSIVKSLSEHKETPGGTPISCSIGISSGKVSYGNIGARGRLDFTVIGRAANLAARLSDHGKKLEKSILVDGATAQDVPLDLLYCGRFQPRNFNEEVEIYSPQTVS